MKFHFSKKDNAISLIQDYVPSGIEQIGIRINRALPKGRYMLKILSSSGEEVGSAELKVFENFGGIVAVERIDAEDKVFLFLVAKNRLNQQVSVDIEVWPPQEKISEQTQPLFLKKEVLKEGTSSITLELDKQKYGTLELPLIVKLKSKEPLIEPDEDKKEKSADFRPLNLGGISRGVELQENAEAETENENIKKARLAGLFTDRAGTW